MDCCSEHLKHRDSTPYHPNLGGPQKHWDSTPYPCCRPRPPPERSRPPYHQPQKYGKLEAHQGKFKGIGVELLSTAHGLLLRAPQSPALSHSTPYPPGALKHRDSAPVPAPHPPGHLVHILAADTTACCWAWGQGVESLCLRDPRG